MITFRPFVHSEEREGKMPTVIQCPICGAETILRKARKGLDVGKIFYVCIRYPLCKGRVMCEEMQNEEIVYPCPSGQF